MTSVSATTIALTLLMAAPARPQVDQIRVVSSVVQLGMHIGVGEPNGKWQVVGRVYNLTNVVFRTSLDCNSFFGTVYQTLSAPRTFAIEAGFKF